MNRAGVASLVALAALLVSVPPPADGCGIAPRPGSDVRVQSETAVIVYDSTTKTEHFIRTATFNSTSAEFGFLVPTPSKPELKESSALVFGFLADVTKPRMVVERRARPQTFGCGQAANHTFDSVGSAMPAAKTQPAPVQVVEQKRVGGYDATVLQASDPVKLREWLAEHGYEARPQLDEWFKAYTANGWYMTAFKIAAEVNGRPAGPLSVSNSAVRISFKTNTPFYPYREPVDNRPLGGYPSPRLLQVYLLSDARMTGTIGQGPEAAAFPGSTVWSNTLTEKQAGDAFEIATLPAAGKESQSWHLTEFDDRTSRRRGDDEVYFSKGVDQANVERPPNVVVEWYDPPTWPWVLLAGAVPIALLFGGLVVWRMTRQKA